MTNVELPCRKVVIKPLLLFLLLLLLLLSLIIICNPFRGHSRNISKCLANRLPVWRVDVNCNESFDSSRIKLIRQNLQLPFVATCVIFSECLQIDFLYYGSTLTETSRSIRQHFQQPLTVTYEIFCLANWLPVCVSI